MLKRILAILLSLGILVAFTACGDPQETDSISVSSVVFSEVSSEETATQEEGASEEILSAESVASVISSEPKEETESKEKTEPESPSSLPTTAEMEIESVTTQVELEPTSSVVESDIGDKESEEHGIYRDYWVYNASERTVLPGEMTTTSKGMFAPETVVSNLPERTEEAQSLIDWVKKYTLVSEQHQTLFQKTDAARKLLVPFSVRSDLEASSGHTTFHGNSGSFQWSFQSHVSDVLLENEWYFVRVVPLTSSEQKTDLRDYFYPDEINKKIGTYKGLTYAYFDGYQGADRASSVDTAAWFIKDGMLICIEALYVNNYKPWNNEWFDYFGYEIIEW